MQEIMNLRTLEMLHVQYKARVKFVLLYIRTAADSSRWPESDRSARERSHGKDGMKGEISMARAVDVQRIRKTLSLAGCPMPNGWDLATMGSYDPQSRGCQTIISGRKLEEKGREASDSGRKMLDEGEAMIKRALEMLEHGESLAARGEDLVAYGDRLTERGEQMVTAGLLINEGERSRSEGLVKQGEDLRSRALKH